MQNYSVIPGVLLIIGVLTSCMPMPQPPELSFVGVSSGSLSTPAKELVFAQEFSGDVQSVVGVAVFEQAPEGTEVLASWFMPDDRRPPLGRERLTVQSGALVARFSLAANTEWQAGPYLLQIHASAPGKQGEAPLMSSGAVHFFVGMSEEAIAEYRQDYAAWETARREQRQEEMRQSSSSDSSQENFLQ